MTTFERVKETAKKQGLSLTDTSIKAGMNEKAIYKWKYNEPSASRLQAVADVLHVSVDYLLGNTDNPEPAPKSGTKSVVDLSKSNTFAYQGELYDADGIDPDDWDLIKAAFERAKKARKGK
ncbi:helix-turn-helix domain-containing protein [Lacticaseibacillus sp. 53-4]|uniref:helix-turn-helix domain-containing protein n=1 Tax=Lacticaseibacillus sp. 53-4 TaxID=2799575 RepID=UPI001941125D|nr:helix-turn-helix transcriptional regulator [Lacticaseibacillus sp. 53-4]